MGQGLSNSLDDLGFEQIQAPLSARGMNITKKFEGFRPDIYKDVNGHSIGYGFNIDQPHVRKLLPSDVLSGKRPLDVKEANNIFPKLYLRAQDDLIKYVGDKKAFDSLDSDTKDNLVDMSYQLGLPKLQNFKEMKKGILSGDKKKIADEMKDSSWFKQSGRRGKHHVESMTGKRNFLDLSFLNPFAATEASADEMSLGDLGFEPVDRGGGGLEDLGFEAVNTDETNQWFRSVMDKNKSASRELGYIPTHGEETKDPDFMKVFFNTTVETSPLGIAQTIKQNKAFLSEEEQKLAEKHPVWAAAGHITGGLMTLGTALAIPGVGTPVAFGVTGALEQIAANQAQPKTKRELEHEAKFRKVSDDFSYIAIMSSIEDAARSVSKNPEAVDLLKNPDEISIEKDLAEKQLKIARDVGKVAVAGIAQGFTGIVFAKAQAGKTILDRILTRSRGAGANAITESIVKDAIDNEKPDVTKAVVSGGMNAAMIGILGILVEVPQLRGLVREEGARLSGKPGIPYDEAKAVVKSAGINPETLSPEFQRARYEARRVSVLENVKATADRLGIPVQMAEDIIRARDFIVRDRIATSYMTKMVKTDPVMAEKLLPFFREIRNGADPVDIFMAQELAAKMKPVIQIEQVIQKPSETAPTAPPEAVLPQGGAEPIKPEIVQPGLIPQGKQGIVDDVGTVREIEPGLKTVILSPVQIRKLGSLRENEGQAIDGNSLIQSWKVGISDFNAEGSGIMPGDKVIIINSENRIGSDVVIQHEKAHHELNNLSVEEQNLFRKNSAVVIADKNSMLQGEIEDLRKDGYSEGKIADELFAHGLIDKTGKEVEPAKDLQGKPGIVEGQPLTAAEAVKQGMGAVNVKNVISDKTGMKVILEEPPTSKYQKDLGEKIEFSDGKTVVETYINETPEQIILSTIHTKPIGDRTITEKGTGKGTDVLKALKDYADLTGKQLVVPSVTKPAAPYWEKIDFLSRDYVPIPYEGKMQNVGDTFQYTPTKSLSEYEVAKKAQGQSVILSFEEFKQNEIKRLGSKHPAVTNEIQLRKRYDKFSMTAQPGGNVGQKIMEADKADIRNLIDWEQNQPGGVRTSFINAEGQREFTGNPSGHSPVMQEIGPKESFRLLEKALADENMTIKQQEKVQLLLKDFRDNIKTRLETAQKEINNVRPELTEPRREELRQAVEKEKEVEYDWDGNVVPKESAKTPAPQELQTLKDQVRALDTPDLEKLIETRYEANADQAELDLWEDIYAERVSEENPGFLEEFENKETNAGGWASLEEQLIADYHFYLQPEGTKGAFTTDEDVIGNMRAALKNEGASPEKVKNSSDEEILAAAKELYDLKAALLKRQRAFPKKFSAIPEVPKKESRVTQSGQIRPELLPPEKKELFQEEGELFKNLKSEGGMLDIKMIPGAVEVSDLLSKSHSELKKEFNPTAVSAPGKYTAQTLRENLGVLARSHDQLEMALIKARKLFDKASKESNLDFIYKMEEGGAQGSLALSKITGVLRDILDSRRIEIQNLGTGKLQNFIENYFPHIWEDPTKARDVIINFLRRRPFQGPKSFLKKRSIPDTRSGIERGLVPVSYNPIDLVMLKVREMDRYLMAHRTLAALKEKGIIEFVRIGVNPQEGWVKIKDPISDVYKSPEIPVSEYVDEGKYNTLSSIADKLGISHERVISGMRMLGKAYKGKDLVKTKFATDLGVLTHEIGHQLDWKFGLEDLFVKDKELKVELRALSDLRYAGKEVSNYYKKYVRKGVEKMANMVDAYANAPELFKKTAPKTFAKFEQFIDAHPVLTPLKNLESNLQRTKMTQTVNAGGLVIAGHLYAQPDAARILNNYLVPGLRGNYFYDLYRGAGNTLNQFQLGLSAFHLGFTSMDATVSKFALGLNKLSYGNIIGALKEFAAAPFAPVTNFMQGRNLLQAWYGKDRGDLINQIAGLMASGGGRAKMDKFYATQASESFKKSLQEGRILTSVFRVPFWIVEQTSRPILEYIVPRQKMGVFLDVMRMEIEKNQNLSHEELRDIAQKAWDSVDNRMGQLVYDNLFWSRVTKDMAMASVRSLGWNLGTFRELGGGVKDIAAALNDLRQGKPGRFSYRMAYLLALPIIAGIYGAIYQYLHTGKRPEELKDYYFPKTGGIDKNGEEARVSLPTYMKDIYHYTVAPVRTILNKFSPINSAVLQMLANKDFYGTEIRNVDDPIVSQALEELNFVAQQFVPFGIRNLARDTRKTGASRVEPFIGITPAPYDINMTRAERRASEISKSHIPVGARTKGQAEHAIARADIRNAFFVSGDTAPLEKAVKDGTITHREKVEIVKQSKMSNLERLTRHLTFDEVLNVAKYATPAEREELKKIAATKERNKKRAGTWIQKNGYEEFFNK